MSWEAGLRKVCNGYNMIDTEMVVSECKKNPKAECGKLKTVCHSALAQGRDNVAAGKLDKANSNFALAYQARCTCDYIYVHVMGSKGDEGHAAFLKQSRDFGKFCTEGLNPDQAKKVQAVIAKLRDH